MMLASEQATMDGAGSRVRELEAEIARLRAELDRERQAADRVAQAVEHFASALAHDLKNPLGAMRVNVQALKRALENGKELSPSYVVERLERLERAIDQSLELLASGRARLDGASASGPSLDRESVDLVQLVQAHVEAVTREVGDGRISVANTCSSLNGHWDGQGVGWVVRELLDNALKFSPREASVQLTLRHDSRDGMAELTVSDDGIGIPASDLAHVCERFYRAENVLGRYKGAGLGLFQANRCVADHGGTLTLQSEEGRGTAVTLRLPLQPVP